MTLEELFNDSTLKAKAKVAQIGQWLLEDDLLLDELMVFSEGKKGTVKATCIEAMEYVTKKRPAIAEESLLNFVTKTLKEEEPRIKWESAKVIGNIARLFPSQLTEPVNNLLANAEHSGTVVRWATAYALAEILKLKTAQNGKLLPKIETLHEKEEDNGVKKKYLGALKNIKK